MTKRGNQNMTEGCLLCGIKKELSLHPDCKSESKVWGMNLVDTDLPQTHIWATMRFREAWKNDEAW